LGGDIKVESEFGKGSIFTFTILAPMKRERHNRERNL
jgi:signal transduction histidine kinase